MGSRVQLRGLQQRSELNGRCGVILELTSQASGRVPVKLDGNVKAILLKAENVLVLRPQDADANCATKKTTEARVEPDEGYFEKLNANLRAALETWNLPVTVVERDP